MMAFFTLAKLLPSWLYIALVFVILAIAAAVYERHAGGESVRVEWAKSNADRDIAEGKAITQRNSENTAEKFQQAATAASVTKVKNDEIDSLRARLAAAPRLRIGAALCGGIAAPASPAVSGSGDADDSPGRLVHGDVGRDIDALKLAVETDLATGRACQAEARANGMAP